MKRIGLHQIDASGATNGQVATYDATTGEWEPATPTGGGGGKYAADCAATTNPQTFTHGLGTNDVDVAVWEGGTKVYPDITKGDGTVTVDWGAAPAAAQYRVVVQG